jgi:diacylglycerol O-acyltransferase
MAAPDHLKYPLELGTRMLPMDAFLWQLEEVMPEVRMLMGAMLLLDRRPDRDRFRRSFEALIARVPRMQQHVVEPPLKVTLPEWRDDTHFELEYHLRDVALPEPATLRHCFDFCGATFAGPLDHLRPLWEAYLIEGLEGGKAAVFFKMHHAAVDGVGTLALFDALTQAHRADPVRPPRRHPPRSERSAGEQFVALARNVVRDTASLVGDTMGAAARAALSPVATAGTALRVARSVSGMVRDLGTPKTKDPLAEGCLGIGRRLDGLVLDLRRLRAVKDAFGITLNDLMLTALAGAVGRYHDHRRAHVDVLNCLVPQSLRDEEDRHSLGNRVGYFNVALPVGERDPRQRMDRIRHQASSAKGDRRAGGLPSIMRVMSTVPGVGFRIMAQQIVGRSNMICTNIPGPSTVRYLGGAKIEAIYPFAPIMIGTPLSLALVSYGDTYGLGFDTDPGAIPDPELLHRYLEEAVDELVHLAGKERPARRAHARRRVPVRRRGAAKAPAQAGG